MTWKETVKTIAVLRGSFGYTLDTLGWLHAHGIHSVRAVRKDVALGQRSTLMRMRGLGIKSIRGLRAILEPGIWL
jgi:hypothetical protein